MKTKKKANLGSILRLLDFLWKNYKLSLIISSILIVSCDGQCNSFDSVLGRRLCGAHADKQQP